MKVTIDEKLKGKELFQFLKANKQALISEKKSLPVKFSEPVSYNPSFFNLKGNQAFKTSIEDIPNDANSFRVKIVGNACWWCDSQKDVLIDNSAKSTIQQRKSLIKHLRDHEYKLAAEVADINDIYLEDVLLTELGLTLPGKTQCIISDSDVRKDYDQVTFNKYKTGKINQHSIGLQYIKIDMAVMDEEDEKEMDFWNKYAPYVINQEAIKDGYFFVVSEIKLLEISAVLFGSNELTPTLQVGKDTFNQPGAPIEEKPFDLLKAIYNTNFINF